MLLTSALLLVSARSPSGAELESAFAEHWRWVHFTTASGLPSDEVVDLVEDADGIPWVATGAGLAWYDGHRWTPMTEKLGLPSGFVTSLASCSGGGVAVVIEGAAYLGGTNGFRRVLTQPGMVYSIACLEDGSLLVQVHDRVYRVGADGSQELVAVGRPGALVSKLFQGRRGRVLVATTTGLHLFDGGDWSSVIDHGAPGSAWVDIRQAIDVADGDVLFTVLQPYAHQGAWRVRAGEAPERVDLAAAETVVEAAARPDGTVVLAYESGAIGLAQGDGHWSSVRLPPSIGGVTSLDFRENGDLWAGTARGLWLFRESSQRWSVPRRSSEAEDNVVHALMRASDGRLWVGTRAGLEIRDGQGGIESLHRIGSEAIPVVTSIAEDGEGAIWLGSGSGFEGAWRWKDGEWRHFGVADGLLAPFVHAVRVDSSGRPWFLGLSHHAQTGSGPGAFVYEEGRFRSVSAPVGGLATRVYDFAEGPPGTYWFGTHGGLFRLGNGGWSAWTKDDLLPLSRVFALELDENDRPWFTSGRTGVCHLPDDETVNCEDSSDGLPTDAAWDLEFDAEGALWASTRGGLGIRRDGAWSRILPHHGLPLLRLWPLLVEKDHILIGTNGRGLVELRRGGEDLPAPRVSFREVDEKQGSTRVEWTTDAWWGAQAEGEVENRWRLEGGDWSEWSRRRELLFEDLSPGGHLLEIEAKGLFGQRALPARLEFEVPAALFSRPEVMVPSVLVFVSLAGWLGFGAWRRWAFAREIARREKRFASILDNVADVIFTANLDGRLTSMNRAGLELAGPAMSDASSVSWRDLLSPASRDRASQALQQKLREGGTSVYEIEVPNAVGGTHVLEVHSTLVTVPGREPEIQGVARDVTERRRLEAQLHHSQKMESLGLLAGGVAHDFNNLLLSILGNLDLARGACREGTSPVQAFDDLEAAAERATDLARVMLAYSGKARFEILPMNLSALTEEILRLLRASLPSSVEFETHLEEGLPAIEGDRAQVQQVILNLVTNAADAISGEGGTIQVRTGSGPADDCGLGLAAIEADLGDAPACWLQVCDSGPGIDEESRRRIFDPFFTTKGPGRGLGLSAVLGIMRAHHGALHLDSEEGKGSCFRVVFPALDEPAPPPQSRVDRSQLHAESLAGSRVLVVDDQDRVREVACRLLERAGCEVLSACDGLEAQAIVREQGDRLDAVLLDLVMPRCSGEEALVGIREMAPDLPVVLTSGYTEQEVSARQVGSGPTSFLVKPYRLADLEDALCAAFAGRPRSATSD